MSEPHNPLALAAALIARTEQLCLGLEHGRSRYSGTRESHHGRMVAMVAMVAMVEVAG